LNIEQALHFLNAAISSFLSLGPLGLVPATGLLWLLSKSAAHDFDWYRYAHHRTQSHPSAALLRFSFTLCQLQQI
jgi:hypothetical protein